MPRGMPMATVAVVIDLSNLVLGARYNDPSINDGGARRLRLKLERVVELVTRARPVDVKLSVAVAGNSRAENAKNVIHVCGLRCCIWGSNG